MTEQVLYKVIKNAISKELAEFCYEYLKLKSRAVAIMYNRKELVGKNRHLGHFEDPQVPGCYTMYADPVMETLLIKVLPKLNEVLDKELIPTYSYCRLYRKGNKLKRHKDRDSCEISTTLHLGGDSWPIYLEPDHTKGRSTPNGYMSEQTKGIKIDLEPGDMLIYYGRELEHWREPFKKQMCGQVFLHYNDFNGPLKDTNLFDGRLELGLPSVGKKPDVSKT